MKELDNLKETSTISSAPSILEKINKLETTINRMYSMIQVLLYTVNKFYNTTSFNDDLIEKNVYSFVFYNFEQKKIDQGTSTSKAFKEYLKVYNSIFMVNNEITFYHANYINFEKYLYHWRVFTCTFMWLYLHYVIGNNNDISDKKNKIDNIKLYILFNLDYLILCDVCKLHYLQNKNILIYEILNGVNFEQIMSKFHKYINYSIKHENDLSSRLKTIQLLTEMI